MGRKMREDLQGGSEMLKQLQERQLESVSHGLASAASQRSTRYYNLAGSLDVLVQPSKHIMSKRAFWSCWLPHVGHYSILMSETLWDQVAEAAFWDYKCLRDQKAVAMRVSEPWLDR